MKLKVIAEKHSFSAIAVLPILLLMFFCFFVAIYAVYKGYIVNGTYGFLIFPILFLSAWLIFKFCFLFYMHITAKNGLLFVYNEQFNFLISNKNSIDTKDIKYYSISKSIFNMMYLYDNKNICIATYPIFLSKNSTSEISKNMDEMGFLRIYL